MHSVCLWFGVAAILRMARRSATTALALGEGMGRKEEIGLKILAHDLLLGQKILIQVNQDEANSVEKTDDEADAKVVSAHRPWRGASCDEGFLSWEQLHFSGRARLSCRCR